MKFTNIYLIGPMGAGKSTIGRLLARKLGVPFYDSDHEIEARSGADLRWIFDVEGEKGFRLREVQAIEQLCQKKGVVLATGGGAITREENRKQLNTNGFVVFLQASVSAQLERTEKDKKRPLLQQPNREQILSDLLQARQPIYSRMADITIDTESLSLSAIVQEIIHQVEKSRGCSCKS